MNQQAIETFRDDTRRWLEQNCPASMRNAGTQGQTFWGGRKRTFSSDDQRQWFESMRDRGWTVPEWPVEYGGGGLEPDQARVLQEEMSALNCRLPLVGMGVWMIGPTILHFGSEEQKRQHLPAIARGEIRWCQGYSEPNAGSDLASVQCRAGLTDDGFLVEGSKIWTSMANDSDWIFCLVRTDREAPKHDGISFLLVDMASPGIEVRPIELISGHSPFCETRFDRVRVPADNLLGELNQGWGVAKHLLQFERRAMAQLERSFATPKPEPAVLAKRYLAQSGPVCDGWLRQRIVEHAMQARAIALTNQRVAEEMELNPAAAMATATILKYIGTEQDKRKLQLNIDLMGSRGLGWEGPGFAEQELQSVRDWLQVYGLTIAGGTSEIQLNVIAKRVLGLPD